MGILRRTVSKPAVQQSFADRMASIKEVFKKAYDNASTLKSEMQSQIESKEQSIAKLNSEIETINVTKKEVEQFMSNLEKFI